MKKDKKNNIIIGNPTLIDTKIIFNGSNNILFCDENVKVINSEIKFLGNNSVIYLSSNSHSYLCNFSINNNSVFYMGKNNYINGKLNVVLSEEKNVFIGNNCLFAFNIWIRTADPHLIYSCKNHKRINYSKSVFIGDHVWIGQDVLLLKGTQIASGSIIAGGLCVLIKK